MTKEGGGSKISKSWGRTSLMNLTYSLLQYYFENIHMVEVLTDHLLAIFLLYLNQKMWGFSWVTLYISIFNKLYLSECRSSLYIDAKKAKLSTILPRSIIKNVDLFQKETFTTTFRSGSVFLQSGTKLVV